MPTLLLWQESTAEVDSQAMSVQWQRGHDAGVVGTAVGVGSITAQQQFGAREPGLVPHSSSSCRGVAAWQLLPWHFPEQLTPSQWGAECKAGICYRGATSI